MRIDTRLQPCAEWEEQLAARHPDDLWPDEQSELKAHLATCPACAQVYADYALLTERIRALPASAIQPLPRFTNLPDQTASQNTQIKDVLPLFQKRSQRRSRKVAQSIIAATLVCCLLAGFVVTFAIRQHSSTGVASTSGVLVVTRIDNQTNAVSLVGLRADTGATLWTYDPQMVVGAHLPSPIVTVQNHVVYATSQSSVYALDLNTGIQLWQQDLHTPLNADRDNPTQLMLDHGMIYLINSGQLYALDASSGQLTWHQSSVDMFTVSDGIVYTDTLARQNNNLSADTVTARRGSDGTFLWSYPAQTGSEVNAMTVAKQVLYMYVTGYDNLLALNARTGKQIWLGLGPTGSAQTQGVLSNDTFPIIVGKKNVVQFNGWHFCAYQISDGSRAWCTSNEPEWPASAGPTPAIIPASYVAQGNTLYVGESIDTIATPGTYNINSTSDNGHGFMGILLEAINMTTGTILWSRTIKHAGWDGPIALVHGELCTIFSTLAPGTNVVTNHVMSVQASSGHDLWQQSDATNYLVMAPED